LDQLLPVMDVYVENSKNMAEAWLCLLKETEQTSYRCL
jgi:hypothetical protein